MTKRFTSAEVSLQSKISVQSGLQHLQLIAEGLYKPSCLKKNNLLPIFCYLEDVLEMRNALGHS
jgi:hypothetical protein